MQSISSSIRLAILVIAFSFIAAPAHAGFVCHDICVTGAPLNNSCDPCVPTITAADPACTGTWDSVCVSEVRSICGSLACCGDGTVNDQSDSEVTTTGDLEECDDGDTVFGDNCCTGNCKFAASGALCQADNSDCTGDFCLAGGTCSHQAPAPVSFCLGGDKTKLQIKNSTKAGKDQLKVSWGKGSAFDQADLGNPVNVDSYTLCIYDETTNVDSLKQAITIDPSTKWISKDPKGFQYKDKAGASEGVVKAKFKTGADKKTKVQVQAKGANYNAPTNVDAAAMFDQDANVRVQLLNRAGVCWDASFGAAATKKNTPASFKAQNKQ